MKTDVLVAGAGPVGLTMASELTRYGLSVRIVDKNTQRTDKSKALVLWARTLELIDRMSPNCADRVRKCRGRAAVGCLLRDNLDELRSRAFA